MTSSVTAGLGVIPFENKRLQAVYCIPVTRLLLGYRQGQRSEATSQRICHNLTGHLLLCTVGPGQLHKPSGMARGSMRCSELCK